MRFLIILSDQWLREDCSSFLRHWCRCSRRPCRKCCLISTPVFSAYMEIGERLLCTSSKVGSLCDELASTMWLEELNDVWSKERTVVILLTQSMNEVLLLGC